MNTTTSSSSKRPRVLIPTCQRLLDGHIFHAAGRKYVEAVRLAGCMPLLVPATEVDALDELLDLADGVLLTGSPSNVHPVHFNEDVYNPELPLDPERDALTLAMVRQALERSIPLLAICRGFQEVNVALGGTLHQAVHEVQGLADHREDSDLAVDLQYGTLAHPVSVEAGGLLDRILGLKEFMVNSLHGQGVKGLAAGLSVEARAPDGLVEAFSDQRAAAFNLAVQWHPEWAAAKNPISMKLFAAFGQACQQRRQSR